MVNLFYRGNYSGLLKIASAAHGKTGKKSYGWAYVKLPQSARDAMKLIRDKIDPKDLAEDGKEGHPHITVKYGLTGTDPDNVKRAVKSNRGGTVKLGKTTLFSSPEQDVLKVSITGHALHTLNKSLSTLDNEDKYPIYVPHATLAYLKPGTGKKYSGLTSVAGTEFTFDSFVFQDAKDIRTEMTLDGQVPEKRAAETGWIGVDLDGTLAKYTRYKGDTDIGDPIPKMVTRVKDWLAAGKLVRIFTARANKPAAVKAIEKWCKLQFGKSLPVTNIKDHKMVELWDDRAHRVEKNTGVKLAADYAPGIPDKRMYGDPLGTLKPGDITDFVLQHHSTVRNPKHPHYDLRLGTPATNLYSWAVPNADMPGPGEVRRPIPQTYLHAHQYGSFEGKLGPGYGAGTVRMADKGKAIVTRVTPNTLHFTLGHTKVPTRYVLVHLGGRDGKLWQLIGRPMPGKVPGVGEKPIYKQISAVDQDEAIAKAVQVQEKIDGAHGLLNIGPKGEVDIYSVNPRTTGQPISHTERMGLFGLRVPRSLRESAFRGEMYYTDRTGKAISFKDTSGLLNSLPAKSLETQRSRGLRPRIALFDAIQQRGQRLEGSPLTLRQQYTKELLQHLPAEIFHEPQTATTLSEKSTTISDIKEGRNPRTQEGVMLVMPDDKVMKLKNKQEATGYLTGTFPGTGKRKGTAGGLTFATEPKGEGTGRVGTGFSNEELQDIVTNLEEYMGRPMRLEHQGQFGSGKLRAPSWKGFETDKVAQAIPQKYLDMYTGFDPAHNDTHRERVRENAKRLAQVHAPKLVNMADIAAALHDVGLSVNREDHELHGYNLLKSDPELAQQFKPRQLNMILNAVKQHRASTGRPRSVLGKIISDADRTAYGDAGSALVRCLDYRKENTPDMNEDDALRDSVNHLVGKYGPGGTGTRTYFPETAQHIADMIKPIMAAHQTGDVTSIRKLLPTDKVAAVRKPGSVNTIGLKFVSLNGTLKAAAVVEIADTPERRRIGLSKRASLPADYGMFFDKAGTYWMKDVQFPLDLVFVDKHGTVLEKLAMFLDERLHSPSNDKTAHAIELPYGWCDKHSIQIGDKVQAVAVG